MTNAPRSTDPSWRFLTVHQNFLDLMKAVGDVAAFADEHGPALDDPSVVIARIASAELPGTTEEERRDATAAVIQIFEKVQTARKSKAASGGDVAEKEAGRVFNVVMKEMREHLLNAGTPSTLGMYFDAYMEAIMRPPRVGVLQSALLTAAVGNFEVLISGIVREFLRAKPEVLRGDEGRYSLVEIDGFETLEEFREYCADRYAENLLRGSLEDWLSWFEKRLRGVTASDLVPRLESVVEVFQRRHLAVHNGGRVNRLYLLKVHPRGGGPKIGSRLSVDREYVRTALDLLIVGGTVLLGTVMRRIITVTDVGRDRDAYSLGRHPADAVMHKTQFDLLLEGRYRAVLDIGRPLLAGCTSDFLKLTTQVNNWVAQRELDGADSIRGEVSKWQVAALNPVFAMAKHALLEEYDQANVMARGLIERGELTDREYLTWPLLAGVRAFADNRSGGGRLSEGSSEVPTAQPSRLT